VEERVRAQLPLFQKMEFNLYLTLP
jgi:hypothetical protein